jgi:hypothetical protein
MARATSPSSASAKSQGRRDSVFLATKVSPRDGAEAAKSFEESLKALQVDRVDLLHIHALTTEDDLAKIEAKDGVLQQILKFREQKMARFIGITSHADPSVMKTALERHDFDCTQMALNAGLTNIIKGGGKRGMVPNPAIPTSFESLALPVALRKKMGVLAIKAFAQDHLSVQAAHEKLLTTPFFPYHRRCRRHAQPITSMPMCASSKPRSHTARRNGTRRPALGKNKVALDEFFRRPHRRLD